MTKNLYKILPTADVKKQWFTGKDFIGDYDTQRKSLDGSYMVIKLPIEIQVEGDVPPEKLATFQSQKPYLTHDQVKSLIKGDPFWENSNE